MRISDCGNCGKNLEVKFIVDGDEGFIDFCSYNCAKEYIINNIEEFILEVGNYEDL